MRGAGPVPGGSGRVRDGRHRVQHLADPFRARRRPGSGHEHVHRHHDGDQDLQDVGHERGEGAQPHFAGVDPVAAEPDDAHRGKVDHQHDHRHHSGHQQSGAQVVAGEVLVGLVEAADFVVLTDKAADDIRADDLLAQHPADPVKEALALAVEGNQPAHDHGHDHREDRDHRDHDPGQGDVLVHGQCDAADEDGGGGNQHGEDQDCEVLDLGDVVGGPVDEAGRTEDADLLGGEGLHLGEQFPAQLAAQRHGDDGAQVSGRDGRDHLNGSDSGHPAAEMEDLPRVAADDAVVDDRGIEGGQQQVGGGLHKLEHNDGQHAPLVRGQQPRHQAC